MSLTSSLDRIAVSEGLANAWAMRFAAELRSQLRAHVQVDPGSVRGLSPAGEGAYCGWEQPLLLGPETRIWAGLSTIGLNQWLARSTDAASDDAQLEQTLFPLLEKTLKDIAAELHRDLQISEMCPSGIQRSAAPDEEYAVSGTISSAGGPLSFLFIGPAGDIPEALWHSLRDRFAARMGLEPVGSGGDSATMGLLLDVELPLKISFGKSVLPLKDVLKLSAGSLVELNRSPDDPVEIVVNNRVIALGEVVAVDGNYGVRIQKIGGSSRGFDLDELLGSAAANLAAGA